MRSASGRVSLPSLLLPGVALPYLVSRGGDRVEFEQLRCAIGRGPILEAVFCDFYDHGLLRFYVGRVVDIEKPSIGWTEEG
jgi:hypothetical protein